jgi:TPR repeat protein
MGLHDFAKALQWYQKVRGLNKSFALRGIGLLYEYGDGVEQDDEKAVAFYKDAVNARNNGACYNLGLMYYYGKGVEQDYSKAFEWLTQAVKRKPNSDGTHIFVQDSVNHKKYVLAKEDLGYGKAHHFLGIMYENGFGIPKDSDQAKKHLDIFNEYCIE